MGITSIIITGGESPHPHVRARLPSAEVVIAADSGLDHAETLGLAVDLVLGDMDSVSEDALARARAGGIPIEEHPPDKDHTDLELALRAAIDRRADRIVVVSGGAGRLDHLLAGLLVLAVPAANGVATEAFIGAAHVTALHGPGEGSIAGRPGELLTLLAIGGPALGVRTGGLRYPLCGETLDAWSARGVSNEFVATMATVSFELGTLLAVQPDALDVAP